MKAACLLGLLMLMTTSCWAQLPVPKQSGGKFGYALNGVWVVEPTLQYATHFSEGRALVKQHDLWGYLDSLGNWFIQPEFTQAQPFKDAKAVVFKGQKKGLMHVSGDWIVQPLYDDFEVKFEGIEVRNNGKIGWISEGWKEMIPTEYLGMSSVFDFYCAKRGYQDYDLYFRGKLLQKGLSEPLLYDDVFPDAKRVRVAIGTKQGLIDYEGNWIVPADYFNITYHFLGDYPDNHLTHAPVIFDLDATHYVPMEEMPDEYRAIGPVQHYLADVNGMLLDKDPFELIDVTRETPAYGKVVTVELIRNGKLNFLEKNGRIRQTEWESISTYLDWRIYTADQKAEIVHKSGKHLGTFERVEPPYQTLITYDEYGEPYASETDVYAYLPYAVVTKTIKGEKRYAIFELEQEMLITDWLTIQPEISLNWTNSSRAVYQLYNPEEQAVAFYVYGSEEIVKNFPYKETVLLESGVVLARNKSNTTTTVFEITDDANVNKLLEAPYAVQASTLYEKVLQPSEVEGMMEEVMVPRFNGQFILFQSENGKYGVITVYMHKVLFPAIYDTIFQDAEQYFMLHTPSDNGWGGIHLYDATMIPAIYPNQLHFQSNEMNGTIYVAMQDHYMNASGKRFYSLNGEIAIYSHKKGWGIKSGSDFKDETRVLVPPIYKSLRQLDESDCFLAQNKKGLFGIINQFNDTIFPFIYTSIETNGHFAGPVESYIYRTTIGKKHGIIEPRYGFYIPAVYDEINHVQEMFGIDFGLQVSNEEKTGLFSYYRFMELFPCELDAFWARSVDYTTDVYIQCAQKWYTGSGYGDKDFSFKKWISGRAYDLIINDTGYVATESGFDAYALIAPYQEPINMKAPSFAAFDGIALLFLKNGKIGVKDLEGKIIIPAELTLIEKFDENTISTVKNGKQGFYTLSTGKFYTTNEW